MKTHESRKTHRTAERQYLVFIERDEDGIFVASCPALHGCVTEGDTYAEALAAIQEAIEGQLEARRAAGDPLPEDVQVEHVRVAA